MRCAVYWAPEIDHPLWQAGCDWLGRDPARDEAIGTPHEATDAPRRYGFHATLKAPFTPAGDRGDFEQALGALAATLPRFAMPPLHVDWLSDFLALRPAVPIAPEHPLRHLADTCVRELDTWRAPLSEAELQRRLANGALDDVQQALLRRFGYPHVLDRWRFHMTLTDSVPAGSRALRERLQRDAQAHFAAALAQPLHCESLSLFVEPAPDAPFRLARRFPLAAT